MRKAIRRGKWRVAALAIILLAGCGIRETPLQPTASATITTPAASTVSPAEADAFTEARLDLVKYHIEGAGIKDEDVLRAMRAVPRHKFVPSDYLDQAYEEK